MPSISDLSKTPRRELDVFFILGTSESMSGLPIATLNTAMPEMIAEIKEQAKHNADALVKVAVMEYGSGCRWVTNDKAPEELEDFVWQKLMAGGLRDMGAALKELNSKLSRHAFLSETSFAPVIIFWADGYATDNYKDALDKIRLNKWFQLAIKIGLAIGENTDKTMLAEITGTPEAVIKTDDLEQFAKMIRFVSVTGVSASGWQTETDAKGGGEDYGWGDWDDFG